MSGLAHHIIEAVKDCAVIELDPGGIVASWNPGAEILFGYTSEQVLGKHHSIFFSQEDIQSGECDRQLMTAAFQGGKWEGSGWRMRRDGSRFWATAVVNPTLEDGGLTGFVVVIRDQSRVRAVEENLRLALADADSAARAQSHFLSRASHELRTPLTAIIGYTDLMRLTTLTEQQQQFMAAIGVAGENLLELVSQLLDVGWLDAHPGDLALESVVLAEVLREAEQQMLPLAMEHEVSLQFEALTGLNVMANAGRLRQVLINLLSNAIKYNRRHGSVRVYVEDLRQFVRIVVQDTGVGLSREQISNLFKPFERVGAERSTTPGTGLGLVVTEKLVEAMGGTIAVTSRVGTGSKFEVRLKRAVSGSTLATLAIAQSSISLPPGLNVLVIEDNAANAEFIGQVGVRHQWQVSATRMGEEGLVLARQQAPDLIILDLQLPDVDGAEVLARLKEDAGTRDIPVLVMTGDAVTRQGEELLRAGAAAFITKPFHLRKFEAVVQNVVKAAAGSE